MNRPWWPFVEFYPGHQGRARLGVPPHVRVFRLVYSRYLDWAFRARVRHLFWRFWWVS